MPHLDRTWKLIAITLLFAAMIAGVVIGMTYLTKPSGRVPASTTMRCSGDTGTTHQATINHGRVSPVETSARLCDRLTITNLDDRSRLVAFGIHDSHRPYDGVEERVLARDQSLTVTLNQSGHFVFHDHFDDSVKGAFTVSGQNN